MAFTLRSQMTKAGNPAMFPATIFSVETIDAARGCLEKLGTSMAAVADTVTIEAADGTVIERWTLQYGKWKATHA